MYQREAMWIQFNAPRDAPKAIKIAVGKVNAITGKEYNQRIQKGEQDYCVAPTQPWIDGINNGNGTIKQFIAMPLGQGYTVEEQVTGKAEFGGIQLCVFDSKQKIQKDYDNDYKRRDKKEVEKIKKKMYSLSPQHQNLSDFNESKNCQEEIEDEESEMGISSGGKMKQKIYNDPYGFSFWNESKFGRVFVHIVNSTMYERITGKQLSSSPIDAYSYQTYQYPWFDIYDEGKKTVKQSNILNQVKTVKEIDQQKYSWPQDDNSTVNISNNNVITLKPKVKDSIRDGKW